MPTWKRAFIFGSLGVGAALFLSGKRPAGAALAGVGLAVLAIEKRDELDGVWRDLPELLDRGSNLISRLADLGQRIVQETQRRAESEWQNIAH
jgi:hypothetical protein